MRDSLPPYPTGLIPTGRDGPSNRALVKRGVKMFPYLICCCRAVVVAALAEMKMKILLADVLTICTCDLHSRSQLPLAISRWWCTTQQPARAQPKRIELPQAAEQGGTEPGNLLPGLIIMQATAQGHLEWMAEGKNTAISSCVCVSGFRTRWTLSGGSSQVCEL